MDATDELLSRLEALGAVRARRMFGGVGLYCDELFFGLVAEGVLYFKVDETSRAAYVAAGSVPFQPFADRAPLGGYYVVPERVLASDGELLTWAARAVEVARSRGKSPRPSARKSKRRTPRSEPIGRLANLGPKSAAWLASVGVRTRADLERLGSVRAYQKVLAAGLRPSLNLLYALEGALLGLRHDRLPAVVKENLRERAARPR